MSAGRERSNPRRRRPAREGAVVDSKRREAGVLRGVSAAVPTIELPRELLPSLAAGHPWVYRDHVPRGFHASDGDWIGLRCGSWEGYALWDASSAIALRVYSTVRPPDDEWIERRVEEAWSLREPLRRAGTDAYRCIFGEADSLPGITVDIYGRYAVVLTYAASVTRLLPPLARALERLGHFAGVVHRTTVSGAGASLRVLLGSSPSGPLVVVENGIRLQADLVHGQKSGLFLDHRDNRGTVRALAAGRTVLNLFSYSGAFSVSAALGGAVGVTSVDIAPAAVQSAQENFRINGLGLEQHEFVVGDVFEFLAAAQSQGRRWGMVLCDPPSFAKSHAQKATALKAYVKLHAAALRVTADGGLYAAASCTSQVSPAEFIGALAAGGRQTRRRLQICHEVGQPLDHPQLAAHPEGRYLKFVVARVGARV